MCTLVQQSLKLKRWEAQIPQVGQFKLSDRDHSYLQAPDLSFLPMGVRAHTTYHIVAIDAPYNTSYLRPAPQCCKVFILKLLHL